jgi:phosphoribosylformylglycinamidine cyclo-ligase
VPPLFELMREWGRSDTEEMHRVFNLGLGMLAVVGAPEADAVRAAVGEASWLIGELISGPRGVRLT